ncbi:MAG TPA: hypothetical protein VN635_01365 [Conexibacter sp.]|nr:hypothetical protein [Conexibacter sp.]
MASVDHGWSILRLAELLRTLERHQDRALRILHRFDPDMRTAFTSTLNGAQVARLHRDGMEITQLAEQIETLLAALPEEDPIAINYEDVRVSAEHLLRRGATLDAGAVLLAARLLDRASGLSALAEGLRSSGAYTAWDATTVGSLLSAFRGVTPQLVRRIATAARMAPGTEIASCQPDRIAQLADQLDLHARA